MRRTRLAILGSHPIHYRVPLYRRLAEDPDVEICVFYGDRHGVAPRASRWGIADFVWKMPLTEGYPHVFVPNRAPRPNPSRFFGKVNPGLWPALRRFDPSAVLVSGYAGLYELQGLLGVKLSSAKLLYTADTNALGDGTGLRGERPAWKRAIRTRWLRSLYARTDAVLFPGESAREHYLAHGVLPERLYRFPLAIDNGRLREEARRLAPARGELRARWGIAPASTCVVTVGELAPWKNVAELIDAVARVPSMHLLVVGDGEERGALEARARASLPGRATFTGFLNLDAVGEAYAAADMFALASRYEAWGLVVNEAMNYGLPLVLSDRVGAGPDLVRRGVTGEVYASGDASDLVRALRAVADLTHGDRTPLALRLREDVDAFSFAAAQRGLRRALRGVGLPVEYRPALDA